MFRPSESIASEIKDIYTHNRDLNRMIKVAEEEIGTRKKLLTNNNARLERLHLDKAKSERMEAWSLLPVVVWRKAPDEREYRLVSHSAKQLRVGSFDTGSITLYKPSGLPVGRITSYTAEVDVEKTLSQGSGFGVFSRLDRGRLPCDLIPLTPNQEIECHLNDVTAAHMHAGHRCTLSQ
jgi:hypothetical protein